MHNNYTSGLAKGNGEILGGASGFAERLRASRTKLGISQENLAKKLGVSSTTVQNYEAGQYPRAEVAIRLSQIISCSLDWLLRGSATDPSPEPVAPKPFLQPGAPQPASTPSFIPITGLSASALPGWYNPISMALSTPLPPDYAGREVFALLTLSQTIQPRWIFQGNVLFCEQRNDTEVGDIVYVERHDGLTGIRKIISFEQDRLNLHGLLPPDDDIYAQPFTEELPLKYVKALYSVLLIKLKP